MRRLVVAIPVLLVVLGLGACGAPASPAKTPRADGPFPVTIEHAFGSTTIARAPERIVTLGEDLDTLAALGITPVGYAPTAPGYTDDVPYLKDRIDLSESTALDGATTGEFNVGHIAKLRPDLILASNLATMDQALYGVLSQLAPTLAYAEGWGRTSWQQMSRTIGKAVGKQQKAAAAVAATDRYLTDLRAELPGLRGKTVAGAYYYGTGTFAANPWAASMSKYTDLGMVVSPSLRKALPRGSASNTVSMENVDVLDADLLVLSYDSAQLERQLTSHRLFRTLKVVEAGHVHEIDVSDALPRFAGNAPTLLNIPWLLDNQKEMLRKVATS